VNGQSFATHAHRPVPTAIAGVLTITAFILLAGSWLLGWGTLHAGVVILSMAVFVLVAISRLYTVRLQDRIILLEMKVRAAEVLSAGQDARLSELDPKQVVALRFASDAELGELLDRVIREKLPPVEIKRAIRNWRGDYLRT
jgi:Family of unknown function (DUF6526)